MRLPALLATLAILTLAFAGCSDDGGDVGDGTTSASTSTSKASTGSSSSSSGTKSSTGTSSSSTGTGTADPSNAPPTGSITASLNGTTATFTLTGSDADGDELSWTLDFGDGSDPATGGALPANATHEYAVGNHTANFTLTDGTDPVTYAVTVAVSGAGGPGPQTFHGEWSASWTFGCEVLGIYPAADVTHAIMVVDEATIGKPYSAVFTSTAPNVLDAYGVSFQDGAGTENSYQQGPSPLTGEVPDGTVEIWFYACGGGAHAVDYTAG